MNNTKMKYFTTGILLLIAVFALSVVYNSYITNPWTRDGQVKANVVQISPRISGPIVNLMIKDNQFVKKGDLLFEIDPRVFKAALDEAEASLNQAKDQVKNLQEQTKSAEAALQQAITTVQDANFVVTSAKAHFEVATNDFKRNQVLVGNGAISRREFELCKEAAITAGAKLNQSQILLDKTRAAKIQAEAEVAKIKALLGATAGESSIIQLATAKWEQARLNYEFTKVYAPVDGHVANLTLYVGSQVVANQASLALIDVSSYWVAGFFRESAVARIKKGSRAEVVLMSYPNNPLIGEVDSIGYGISQTDGSTGHEMLPVINPTFEWIRLAQRIPVRVKLNNIPDDVTLRVGTTAAVQVYTR